MSSYMIENIIFAILQCVVRYDKENMAKEVLEKALAANNNEIVIHDQKLEASVLEGLYNVYRHFRQPLPVPTR